MHPTPWFHATGISNVPPRNLLQTGYRRLTGPATRSAGRLGVTCPARRPADGPAPDLEET